MAEIGKKKEEQFKLPISEISRLKLQDLKYIVFRNVFLLTNGIIFAVVGLLFFFGDKQAGLFLGIISLINVLAGLTQDINAWLALEKLQLLTAPHVIRINADGSEESVLVEAIMKGDRIKLKIGDQIPADSTLVEAHSFEINEGLITGESDSFPRSKGDRLLAGSVVTSGSGIVLTETVFRESRIARMTEGVKKYSVNLSPVQKSINTIVKYTGYLLLAVIAFIIFRGIVVHASNIQIVNNIGALASVLVPAGLVFAATLLFAYGAAHLFRRQVLLQEVNATEKLGRIKNLCMDKTGTLTENILVVENMQTPSGITADFAKEMMAAYIQGTRESSQTVGAIKKYIGHEYGGEIAEALNFSSWRRFGAVKIKDEKTEAVILVGPPDIFLPHIRSNEERQWMQSLLDTYAHEGKRVLCVMKNEGNILPHDLSQTALSTIAVFVFFNNLREGIPATVDFFQKRGVRIRIISGDNPETVRAVASLSGVNETDKIVTGKEMESWNQADFDEKAKLYTIFARIVPEQKEKIIDALKKDGFTAMVGDGANDALAIKKADLGIAMFDGAPATRQLASVVLMNNSFTALPGGVELADNVIRSIEIFASIFLNMSFTGFLFFVAASILGYAYPLTPLNMALINYIAIGIPGILITYWVILPSEKVRPTSQQSFLKKILPLAALSAVVQAIGLAAVFILSPQYLKDAQSNVLVLIAFIFSGFVFFASAAGAHIGILTRTQKIQLLLSGFSEFLVLLSVFYIPALSAFFNIVKLDLSGTNIAGMLLAVFLSACFQYGLIRWFTSKKTE